MDGSSSRFVSEFRILALVMMLNVYVNVYAYIYMYRWNTWKTSDRKGGQLLRAKQLSSEFREGQF